MSHFTAQIWKLTGSLSEANWSLLCDVRVKMTAAASWSVLRNRLSSRSLYSLKILLLCVPTYLALIQGCAQPFCAGQELQKTYSLGWTLHALKNFQKRSVSNIATSSSKDQSMLQAWLEKVLPLNGRLSPTGDKILLCPPRYKMNCI